MAYLTSFSALKLTTMRNTYKHVVKYYLPFKLPRELPTIFAFLPILEGEHTLHSWENNAHTAISVQY